MAQSQHSRASYPGFNVAEFRKNGHMMVDWIADYYENLQNGNTKCRPDVKPGFLKLDTEAMQKGRGFASSLEVFNQNVLPGILHWQHPFFMSYFPASVSFSALLGNFVQDAVNTPNFSWTCNPASSEMEVIVMNFLVKELGLPEERFSWNQGHNGGGFIQHTATDGMIVSIRAARQRKINAMGNGESLGHKLVVYGPETAHFCVQKAATVACISTFKKVPSPWNAESQNWVMDVNQLELMIEEDIKNGFIPCFVSASVGATGTCSVDPLVEVARVAEKYKLWFTVDAAYAGVAALLPEAKHHFKGWEKADSIIVNGSKWFGSLFNTSFMFAACVKEIKSCLSFSATYIKSGGNEDKNKTEIEVKEEKKIEDKSLDKNDEEYIPVDFKDLQLSLGRNWRSLKIWWMLHSEGIENVKAMLRRHMSIAKSIANKLEQSGRFDIVTATDFGLVCFRPSNVKTDNEVLDYLEKINKTKETFMVHTTAGGRPVIRLVVCHPLFDENDEAWIVNHLIQLATN